MEPLTANVSTNISTSILTTDVLVVGGGTGGTAAAIQTARRGVKTILVSEFGWLGGMLTSAGVSAPDGNELIAFQTGLWGAFLRELKQRHPEGLSHGWVSFFTYDPSVGAQIFADWAAQANLHWISNQVPLEVLKQDNRVTGVRFTDYTIYATVTIDGTELGDLLALGDIPHRWGWEFRSEFSEPSAPLSPTVLTQTYPVQAPTWVVVLQDFGEGNSAPAILPPPVETPFDRFTHAWENYGGDKFLNYGRLPNGRFMINWPIHGNDYGEGVQRLIGSATERQAFLHESLWHTQSFARCIQTTLDRRYGLANVFPYSPASHLASPCLGGGAYALHPYYRESRRLQGLTTVREQDLLPSVKSCVAALPVTTSASGCIEADNQCDAIAIGNYANDHHYPSGDIKLAAKSLRWGGRWTGTPFTIPYRALIPNCVDGFLVCEKNISVTHMANGATRLQPVVLGIGQAAGMAAALCVEQNCQPRELPVRSLQFSLLTEPTAPAAVIPLFNLPPNHPDWLFWQQYYLDHPENYPTSGYCPVSEPDSQLENQGAWTSGEAQNETQQWFCGVFKRLEEQAYHLEIAASIEQESASLALVTLQSDINQKLLNLPNNQVVRVHGSANLAGGWLLVDDLKPLD